MRYLWLDKITKNMHKLCRCKGKEVTPIVHINTLQTKQEQKKHNLINEKQF